MFIQKLARVTAYFYIYIKAEQNYQDYEPPAGWWWTVGVNNNPMEVSQYGTCKLLSYYLNSAYFSLSNR